MLSEAKSRKAGKKLIWVLIVWLVCLPIGMVGCGETPKTGAELRASATASFVRSFNKILFTCIDVGDDYFIRAIGRFAFAKAMSEEEVRKVKSRLSKARDKYIEAQNRLKKLAFIDDQTREIIELAHDSTRANIRSVEIIQGVLEDIYEKKLIPPFERMKKADEAAKQKDKADKLLIEICDKLLILIDAYQENFTKTQRRQIVKLKWKIEDRLGILEVE